MFEVDEFSGFHALEEGGDLGGVEVAAGAELGFVEGFGDEAAELGVVEKEVEGEVEGDFGPTVGTVLGHFGEVFVGELALDVFVGAAVDFEVCGEALGEFDEAVVEEGEAVF